MMQSITLKIAFIAYLVYSADAFGSEKSYDNALEEINAMKKLVNGYADTAVDEIASLQIYGKAKQSEMLADNMAKLEDVYTEVKVKIETILESHGPSPCDQQYGTLDHIYWKGQSNAYEIIYVIGDIMKPVQQAFSKVGDSRLNVSDLETMLDVCLEADDQEECYQRVVDSASSVAAAATSNIIEAVETAEVDIPAVLQYAEEIIPPYLKLDAMLQVVQDVKDCVENDELFFDVSLL